MSSLVCICMCTRVLQRGTFLGVFCFIFTSWCCYVAQRGRAALYVQTGDPVVNRSPGGVRRRNAATVSERLCFFSLFFQLCSWWDQISLLVRLINYEENSQNEKWLHLTVKPVTSPSDHRAPKWAWPYTGFDRDMGSMAWCAPQQKPARFRYSKIHSEPYGQWHPWVPMRKYSYLRESTSTHQRQ